MAESNKVLISKLLELADTFTNAVRALCEQQNEKVLRFDDDMILELLTRWEQEAGKEGQEKKPDNTSTTSLVTLGATNALERYQITVGRVWEETEVILSSIRKIRVLVEYGTVQHISDFSDDDSEEDAVERNENIKKNLYPTLLFHANGLVTVLGEFLECVSGIQRLVGTIKTQRSSMEGLLPSSIAEDELASRIRHDKQISAIDFMSEEPRPIKHLDPALMKKLKRKTPFNDYDSTGWTPTEAGSSPFGEDDAYIRALSPPESPGIISDFSQQRHRRLSSRGSSGMPKQYWPGSTRIGSSDDGLSSIYPTSPQTIDSPPSYVYDSQALPMSRSVSSERTVDTSASRFWAGPLSTPPIPESTCERTSYFTHMDTETHTPPVSTVKYESKDKRHSKLLQRRNSQTPTFTGASISTPIPTASRPFSVYSSSSEAQPSSRNNYKVRPPKPPVSILPTPPMPPSALPLNSFPKGEEVVHETTAVKLTADGRTNSYLATRSTSPHPSTPLTLDSPFTRHTSIRMANDRNRYSVKMPSDDIRDPIPASNSSFPSAFWRRRSYNDALEKSWKALQYDSFTSAASESSAQSTPVTAEFARNPRSSVRLTSFEFMVPFMSRENSAASSRPGSVSSSYRSLSEKYGTRRHSSPLTSGAERALSEALSRRTSVSSQHSSSQNSNSHNSVRMMPTVDEDSGQRQLTLESSRDIDRPNVAEADFVNNPPRRVHQKSSSHDSTQQNGKCADNQDTRDLKDPGTNESRPAPVVACRPVSASRFSNMKRAWEILNLDAKRVSPYSHLRVYAKTHPLQTNNWALTHPNMLQSSTSPRVLHICESGVDVLVMEMCEGHLHVVAGLLTKLIERLADQNTQDSEYVSCFLLSHSFFIDSEDLLDRLIARFHIQPRQGEMLYFERWQPIIRIKILCVLLRWIQIQFEDFELNPCLLQTLKKFLEVDARQGGFIVEAEDIEENITMRSLSPKKNCSVIMEQGRFYLQRSRTRKLSLSKSQNRSRTNRSSSSPGFLTAPLEPISSPVAVYMIEFGPTPELQATSPILQLDPLQLARYLTLADMKAFRSITVFELMSGWWKRRQAMANKGLDGSQSEPRRSLSGLNAEVEFADDGAIEAFTRRANMLSYWVAHEIVSVAGTKTRKQLIKKFIEVAKNCRELNNLHTAMFIVSALISTPVRRLNLAWRMVSSRDMETLRRLEKLLDPSGNMRNYRQAISEVEALPVIPFL
ncbi:hypothetical protein BGZ54_002682, partial [Gamsiella multidivaricata]